MNFEIGRDLSYEIFAEELREDSVSRTAYGIRLVSARDGGEPCEELLRISDITPLYEKLFDLVSLCNTLKLSPVHIYDVIEDFLSQY